MNVILANKPQAELLNADPRIKTYILELEKKLQNSLLLEAHEKKLEIKCLDFQEELFTLKLQKEENEKQTEFHKNLIHQLRKENERLNGENVLLKVQINKERCQQQQMHNKSALKLSGNIPSCSSVVSKSTKAPTQINKANRDDAADDQADANSVLVKGFSQDQLNENPKTNIIFLGRSMKIAISQTDIHNVSTMERKFYERHDLKPNKIILIVQFASPELKVEFLKNKEKLKLQPTTKDIEIIDYVSEDVYNLYQYAKVLKSHGYVSVYWRNNCVYAKKTRSTYCEPILIKSKNEVDILKVINN